MANDPHAAAFEAASFRTLDIIEAEIVRRGVKGYKEPIIYKGQVTGYVRRFSDNLLMFRAKRMDPAYKDSYNPALITAGGDVTVQVQIPRPGPQVQMSGPDQVVDVEARELGRRERRRGWLSGRRRGVVGSHIARYGRNSCKRIGENGRFHGVMTGSVIFAPFPSSSLLSFTHSILRQAGEGCCRARRPGQTGRPGSGPR